MHAIDASPTSVSADRPLTAPPVEPSDGQAHLLRLVRRVADEDHNAFADLYDELSAGLLLDLERTTEDPVHAAAISAATFVEVWALARFHTTVDTDVQVWVAGIAARRTADRWPRGDRPAASSTGRPWWAAAAASHDRHTQRALSSLLM